MSTPNPKAQSQCAGKNSLAAEEEFSELTKNEIVYWCRKLAIKPSELFTMPKDELEQRLEEIQKQQQLDEQGRQRYYERWEKMSQMKDKLLEKQSLERMRGGAARTIWDILADAAAQIEEVYGDASYYNQSGQETLASYGYEDPTMESTTYDTYNSSRSCPFPTDMTYTISEGEPTMESTFEDSFQIDPNLASTPQVPHGARKLPTNNTFAIPTTKNANANATFEAARGSPGKATTRKYPMDATFDVGASTSYNRRQCPRNDTYNIPSPIYLDESSGWSPQSLAYVDESYANQSSFTPRIPDQKSTLNQSTNLYSLRNFTDYSIKFGPQGTEETANSITVENYDENSGVIKASSESHRLPPSTEAGNLTFDISKLAAQYGARSPTRSPAQSLNKSKKLNVEVPLQTTQQSARSPRNVTSEVPTTYADPRNLTYNIATTSKQRSARSTRQCPAPTPVATTTSEMPVDQTPARTPPNPRRYIPRKISDNFEEE
ncbi:uncharacterized protein LOC131998515 [Stomoxys calcitrans]|uniref:uncharacterized protein LOC131998515 n=1 Tax=Stomoxys calcitrans TaxID=35570 RepID=UPI0027E237D4|nr:uncharacterized protein LOC131998515 [Stomoxys calcitrans]